MAYNNPQYSAYVSTAAGTQAALQGISNSTSKIAQIVNARQQRELQERKAKNLLLDKKKEQKTAAFNTQLSKAVATGKITDVEGDFGYLRDEYYNLVQQYGNDGVSKTDLDFKMSKIVGMIPAFVTNITNQSVDVGEWKKSKPGQRDPAMDPTLGEYLDTMGQTDGYQPPQRDKDGNLTVGGFQMEHKPNIETGTWDTVVTEYKIGEPPRLVRSVNSGAYSLSEQGIFNITEGPLNTQTEIATGINLYAKNSKGEIQEGVLNDKYVQEFIRTGKEGYQQRVQTANTVLIRANIQNATDVQASSYLINSQTAATAWNNNFIKEVPNDLQEKINITNKSALKSGKENGSSDDDILEAQQAFKNDILIKAGLNPVEYEMWSPDDEVTPEKTALMKEGTMRSFMKNNDNLFTEKYSQGSVRPYKGEGAIEISKQLSAFRKLTPQVKANNVNGKAAFWTLSEDKTAYELRQYNEIGDTGLFDMVIINGFAPIPVGDETAFNAAF